MKILKLNHCSMELSDYNLTFVHIKGTHNILANVISRLRTLDTYREPTENPKTAALNNTKECTAEVAANKIQTLSTHTLCAKQRKDINCRNLASQSCHKTECFHPVMMSTESLLQKQQYVHGLKHDVAVAPLSYQQFSMGSTIPRDSKEPFIPSKQ